MYTRYLKRVKNVPSGSGRDAVPKARDFANLEWLDQHISHKKSASNWSNHYSDDECSQLQEEEEVNSSRSSASLDTSNTETKRETTDSPAPTAPKSIPKQASNSNNEVELISKKASKTNRPWAAVNRRKAGSTKENMDVAMIHIAEKLLQEPSEKIPSVDKDSEEMHFARSFAKRLKKLPERAKGFVRIQLEQIMSKLNLDHHDQHNSTLLQ